MPGNRSLHDANRAKKDEFYTQLVDIENELRHYRDHFKGKTVLCNCDDPRVSNFFHYFSYNFESLKLKKLITTCYKNQQRDLFSQNDSEQAIYLEYKGDKNGNRIPDPEEIGIKTLQGDGDFRSDECIKLLKKADIVVTNPPFSLFREYVAQLIEYDKKFLIIGNVNSITYRDCFQYFMDNQMWLGCSIHSGDREFGVPDDYPLNAAGFRVDDEGRKFIRVKGVRWFTNLDYQERHEDLVLYKQYTPEEYPKYDNYDAINVNKTAEIPADYDGVMGVPITFLDKFNPDQFDIVGITKTWFGGASKIYPNQIQVDSNGKESIVSKLNDGATLKLETPPRDKTYYIVDNEYFTQLYARILIRKKKRKKIMKGVEWGPLYDQYKNKKFDAKEIETEAARLNLDNDVTKKTGIYPYIFTREEKHLSIRTFKDAEKLSAYERQKGICVHCKKHFDSNQMEADHITPWHAGGHTTPENCQMLCRDCNRRKSGR